MRNETSSEGLYMVSTTHEFIDKNIDKVALSYKLKQQSLTLEEIFAHVSKGYPIVPVHLKDYGLGRNKENFRAANLIMLDIDSGISLEKFVELWGYRVLGAYTSPSHRQTKNGKAPEDRFRVLIALPKPVDNPVLYSLIVTMLIHVTGADAQCSDPARAYYGNSRGQTITCNPDSVLDFEDLFADFYALSNRKAYKSKIEAILKSYKDTSIDELIDLFGAYSPETRGPIFPHPVKENTVRGKNGSLARSAEREPHPVSERKTQHFDFVHLRNHCYLIQHLIDSDHAEWRHVARNLHHLEGGRKRFLQWVDGRPYDLAKRPSDYYARTIRDFSDRDASPTYCASNCSHYGTARCPSPPVNLLELQRVKPGEIRVVETSDEELLPLEVVRPMVQERIKELTRLCDGNWHFIRGVTGCGKSKAMLDAVLRLRTLLVGPTHELLQQMRPDVPIFPQIHEKLKRDLLAHYDRFDPMRSLKDYYSSFDPEGLALIQEYEQACVDAFKEPSLRITTERLFVDRRLPTPELIVFDEDPMSRMLKEGQVSLSFVKRFQRRIGFEPSLQKIISRIIDCPTGKVFHRDWDMLEDHSQALEAIAGDVADDMRSLRELLWCDAFLISHNHMGKSDASNGMIEFITLRRLSESVTTIILSATIDEQLYRRIYPGKIVLHDFPGVKPSGRLIQIPDMNCSKTALDSPAIRKEFVASLHAKADDGFTIISYKALQKDLPEMAAYFGNTEGFNRLRGKGKYLIAGTPNIREETLKLRAAVLHMDTSRIRGYFDSQPQSVAYKGFEFWYMLLSDDPEIQALQLSYTETQLLQAVGRARYYEDSCLVELWSNFPLKGFYIQKSGD